MIGQARLLKPDPGTRCLECDGAGEVRWRVTWEDWYEETKNLGGTREEFDRLAEGTQTCPTCHGHGWIEAEATEKAFLMERIGQYAESDRMTALKARDWSRSLDHLLTDQPEVAATITAKQPGQPDPDLLVFDTRGGEGEIAPTLDAANARHTGYVAPLVIQKRKDRPEGGLYVQETDVALTVGSTDLTAIVEPLDDATGGALAEALVFQQNQRNEVRLTGGDGQQAGAVTAQPGMKQQNFVAVAIDVRHLKEESGEISGALQAKKSGGHSLNYQNPIAVSNTPTPVAGDIVPTLQAKEKGGGRMEAVAGNFGVRRLTPVEVMRLQAFPDDWNQFGIDENGKVFEQKDSPRYRQAGNAVTVFVIEFFAKRLRAILDEESNNG
jgi:hypothetical protein